MLFRLRVGFCKLPKRLGTVVRVPADNGLSPPMRVRSWFLGVVLAVAPAVAPAADTQSAFLVPQPEASTPAFVTTSGKKFIGPDGQPFLIKGINLGNWLMPEGYMFKFKVANSPRLIGEVFERLVGAAEAELFWQRFRDTYITRDDIHFIKAAGFNTVRVPLHYRLFITEGNPPTLDGPGFALLDRLVDWCREAGLLVVFDMHAAPGGQTGVNHDDGPGFPLLFYVPDHQDLTVRIWQAIARRYRHEPTVLGYDLLNEPIAPYHDSAYLVPKLEPFYRRLVSAIREVGDHHVIFLAGPQWSSTFNDFGPPFADKLAYTYHKFWSHTTRQAVREYIDFSNRYDVPIWLGETGELTDAWNQDFRTLHEKHGIGWCFWAYKNMDTPSTVVSVPRPQGWDAIVAYANAPRSLSGEATAPPPPRQAVLATLAAYLENIRLANAKINGGYLRSLGLRTPAPILASGTAPH